MTAEAKTLQAALVEALAEMPDPVKNADNPAFKRDGKPMRYADLEATLDACKPVLAACGIALMQMPVSDERGLGVHTILVGHGETMDCGSFTLPLEAQTPQKAAGAITYARRYALTALFGLAQEDDDGNAVSAAPATSEGGKTYGASGSESPANGERPSEGQVKAVWAKAKVTGISVDGLKANLLKRFGKDNPDDLTKAEIREVLDGLAKREKELAAAPPVDAPEPEYTDDPIPF